MIARVAIALLALSASAAAQTLPSGVIDVPPIVIGDDQSIGSDTTLNVADGGVIGDSFDAGLPDQINSDVVVNITSGTIGSGFEAHSGSRVNISGGTIGGLFDAGIYQGSSTDVVVNVSGGTFEEFYANSGSVVTISGGMLPVIRTVPGSEVTIAGGAIDFLWSDSGTTELVGGDFRVNGRPFDGASVKLVGDGGIFTGTLADGNSFLYGVVDVALTRVPLPPEDLTPIVVDGANPTSLGGLRPGQALTLREGGKLRRGFAAIGAMLKIDGGSVGGSIFASNSEVIVSAGAIAGQITANSGSAVSIAGGSFDGGVSVNDVGSTLAISGGEINGDVSVSGSTLAISGGEINKPIFASHGAAINILGTDFAIDGVLMDLTPGSPTIVPVPDLDARLTGFLQDGTPFTRFVVSGRVPAEGLALHSNSVLTVTLVPEPAAATLSALALFSAAARREQPSRGHP